MSKTLILHSRPTINPRDKSALGRALASGHLTPGRETAAFEKELSKYIGVKHSVALGSGHAALQMALLALGVGPGADVIAPTYACSALLNAVGYTGAKPVIADVDPDNFNITPETAAHCMTRKARAIIAVHTFGMPCDITGLKKLGVPVIEDAAMAIGAPVGKKGALAVFSFYATKMLATGQGGAVATGNAQYAGKIRDLITHDKRDSYRLRYNYAMSDLASALGRSQLSRLDSFVRRRRSIAGKYMRELKKLPGITALPSDRQLANGHVFFRFCIKTRKTAKTLAPKFRRLGIEVKEPVYRPIHRYLKLAPSRYPMCESFAVRVLSLPIYPSLKDGEIRRIIRACGKILG
ncbi:MAG: DegT/DnrJ/EryC1/StrS family aminotransferase [Planctomycetota bacterium]